MTAIEAYNIKPDMIHADGSTCWPLFPYLKEPRWRVSSFESLVSKDWAEVCDAVKLCVSRLKWPVKEIRLMGSYFHGGADLVSDIDFGIIFEKHKEVCELWSTTDKEKKKFIWHPEVIGRDFFDTTKEMSCRLGIKLEIAPWWGNDVGYDILSGTYHGKVKGQKLEFTKPDGAKADLHFWNDAEHDVWVACPRWPRNEERISKLIASDPWRM